MSCPRQPEAAAFLLEEAAPDYAQHLEDCASCQEALLEAAETLDAVGPAFEEPGTMELDEVAPPAPPSAWQKHWPLALGAALLLVAVALNALRPMTPAEPQLALAEASSGDSALASLDPSLSLEDQLDLLDHELDALSFELEEL